MKGWHSRGYLPHLDNPEKIQHVTLHLADSIPLKAIRRIDEAIKLAPENKRGIEKLQRLHDYLDAGYGSCWLKHGQLADIVANCIKFFDGERLDLHAFVVMPNHAHVLFRPYPDWSMQKTVSSWKSFSAREIKAWLFDNGHGDKLGDGPLWQPEYWDRYIRDESHYKRVVDYIHQNPVKAGLCQRAEDWPWSSAADIREA
ncbi:REP-associated tyrosine transposase [Cerasicoccus fimbriatus]|uniref:REP-associated tyrosine transposase n=1 Tax=Cerasicoccus fimbriatus TaxID=3014554 RepID=UPI0022B51D20|nr:transposase [Cerasicoccus sp. TK19100]